MPSLHHKIKNFKFQPEIYVYPTPRTYLPLKQFNLHSAKFTEEINLYLHIPFCKQICAYCGYLKIIDGENLREKYVNSLIKEIEMYKDVLKNKIIRTFHIGGGTPSLLDINQLTNIFEKIIEINPNIIKTAEEISIEATPESIDFIKFSKLKKLGINRVSLGIQSLNEIEIALSRRHNLSKISINAIKILKKLGIKNIVADLMIGIEGQTVKTFERSVQELIKLKPDTVELYALGIMPQSSLGKTLHNLMSNKEIYQCYDIGRKLFLNAGYKQDCHNRYAIPGRGSFLQEDYVFQGKSLIGFGAGARSYSQNIHYRNTFNINNNRQAILEYIFIINSGKLSIQSGIFINPEEQIRQYAIYHIECLDKKEFYSDFGIKFEEKFQETYNELLKFGLAIDNQKQIKLTEKGLTFRDLIARQFFSEKVNAIEELYRTTKV